MVRTNEVSGLELWKYRSILQARQTFRWEGVEHEFSWPNPKHFSWPNPKHASRVNDRLEFELEHHLCKMQIKK